MNPEVYLVLIEFGQEPGRAALELLRPTLRRLFPDANVRAVVVDNAHDGDAHMSIGDGIDRVSGDNTLREFSGWDRGMAWLEQRYRPAPGAIAVLANDTVARADKHGRVHGLPADRVAAASRGAMVGWIDEYPRMFELFGLTVRQWIDTSLVIAEWRTLVSLLPLAQPLDDRVFGDDWRTLFREPSPLSGNYRRYLNTYFFGGRADGEFEHAWYAQQPLSEQNFEAFKLKLRSVFCEHLLSARARARGIPLVDIRPAPLAVDLPGDCRVVAS